MKHANGIGLLLKSCRFPLYLLVAARLTALSFILTRFRIVPSVFSTMLDKWNYYTTDA
jgi:hypothetical protein